MKMVRALIGPQSEQRGDLGLGQPFDIRNIEAFIGAVAAQSPYEFGGLKIPDPDRAIIATTGGQAPIRTHLDCMDGILVTLTDVQELPRVHLPPAQASIAPSCDQRLPMLAPG